VTERRRLLIIADRVHAPGSSPPGGADAVLVEGDRIAAVGRAASLTRTHPDADRLELPGATLTPGLCDAHIHLVEWALARREVDLTTADSPQAAADRVAGAPTGDAGWIRGRGWNPHRWNGEAPRRELLDRAAPGRPVALQSHDMHALWASTAALDLAGIDTRTPDPPGGRIVRTPDGAATGLLLENAARLVTDCVPAPQPDDLEATLLEGQAELHRLGITAVHSFPGIHILEPEPLGLLESLRARGRLRLRVLQHIALDRLDAAIRVGLRSGFGGDWIRVGGVKMFLDGALGSRTAWMREPYEGSDDDFGMCVLEPATFREHVRRAADAGIASTVHAIGDAAVDLAFNVLSAPGHRVAALPHRVEHVQCCPPGLFGVPASAGIICSMQPAHLITDWRAADRHWGEARAAATYAFRSLLDNGAVLAFGSDAPVEPVDPRLGFLAATERRDLDAQPPNGWHARERIDAAAVLSGYTTGPAHAAGLAGMTGILAPGAWADIAAWSEDPLALPPGGWPRLQCVATLVGGDVVHRFPSGLE
jgi:predicted amidohydrolase YtcJ